MDPFGINGYLSYLIPQSANQYFSWDFYKKWSHPITGDIPLIGENPLRFTSNSNWHTRVDYEKSKTKRYKMMEAICDDDLNSVRRCLDLGFDVNSEVCHERGINALGLTAMLDRPVILKYLLLRGANLESRDITGNTPLMNAVKNWQYESLKILIENGADIDAIDKYGKNSIEKGQDRGLISIVNYLNSWKHKEKTKPNFPKFGLKFRFENMFSDNENLVDNTVFFDKGTYYPFNSLSGSYVIESIGETKLGEC